MRSTLAGVLLVLVAAGVHPRPAAAGEPEPPAGDDRQVPVRKVRPNGIFGLVGAGMIGSGGASPTLGALYVRNLGAHFALEVAVRWPVLIVGGEAGLRAYLLEGAWSPYAALRVNVSALFPFMEPEAHTRSIVHLAPTVGIEAAASRGFTASLEVFPWLGSLGWARYWFVQLALGYRF